MIINHFSIWRHSELWKSTKTVGTAKEMIGTCLKSEQRKDRKAPPCYLMLTFPIFFLCKVQYSCRIWNIMNIYSMRASWICWWTSIFLNNTRHFTRLNQQPYTAHGIEYMDKQHKTPCGLRRTQDVLLRMCTSSSKWNSNSGKILNLWIRIRGGKSYRIILTELQ
jgi:hypothetical protein